MSKVIIADQFTLTHCLLLLLLIWFPNFGRETKVSEILLTLHKNELTCIKLCWPTTAKLQLFKQKHCTIQDFFNLRNNWTRSCHHDADHSVNISCQNTTIIKTSDSRMPKYTFCRSAGVESQSGFQISFNPLKKIVIGRLFLKPATDPFGN